MTALTPNQGLTLPVGGDLNNIPTHLGLYNAGVENRLVQRFLNAADRATRNPTPNEGELSYLTTDDRFDFYNGSAWVTLYMAGAWNSYSPTWGVTSGALPSLGNGTLVGRYQQVGKTVTVAIKLTMGSTTTYGGGQWTLTLPVTAQLAVLPQVLFGRTFDTSAPNAYIALGHISSGGFMSLETQGTASDTDVMQQGAPVTFASGDFVTIQGTYEAA